MKALLVPLALAAAPFVALAGVLAVRAAGLARSDSELLASDAARAAIRRATRVRIARAVVVSAAFVLMTLALARPAGAPVAEQTVARGADVIIAIDVSLSMLARDASPSRIERARAVLRELVDRLEGNRIGLVAFSGSSGILLPLTLDTDAARLFADQLQVASVDAPGTSLDRAVDRSIEMFDAAGEGEHVLVVLSDGEDLSTDPVDAAAQAAARAEDANVRIASVQVGSSEGATIPLDVLGSNTLKHGPDGEPVVTRARPEVMAALGSRGLVLDASTGDEADRIAGWVGTMGQTTHAAGERTARSELFQIPLAIALALLVFEYAIGAWRGR